MANYCVCGSLMIDNNCTNLKCKFSQKKKPVKKEARAVKVYKRKNSRVLTYSIEEHNKKQGQL